MYMLHQSWRRFVIAAVVCLICSRVANAADDTPLTKEQIKHFLPLPKSLAANNPKKASLSPGTLR